MALRSTQSRPINNQAATREEATKVMREFFEIAFSFPAIVFTITTIFFLGFWVLATAIGAGMNSLDDFDFGGDADVDIDIDVDVDVDTDLEIESDSNSGILRSALEFLGITGMPLLIAINLLSLLSWMTAMVAVVLLGGSDSTLSWLLGIPVVIGSFFVGGFLTGRIARKFSHVFIPTLAVRQRQFVGSTCTITTQRVTADFGQAEVRDDEGGSLIVQVRCPKANDLSTGDRALIFDLDTDSGAFSISPDKSLAP